MTYARVLQVAAGLAAGGAALFGCLQEDECGLPPMERTPRGFLVHVPPQPSVAQGLFTKEQAFAWLEARIDQWVEQRGAQYGREHCYAVAFRYPFILYDDYRFACAASPTGWCAGQHWGDGFHCKRIEACIWSRAHSYAYPHGAPAHTIRESNGTYTYGYLPDGVGLAVIPHELDHAIGIHHD